MSFREGKARRARRHGLPPPADSGACWLFLRGLGVVYLIAFASLWVQIEGLAGSRGILPVGEYLDRAHAAIGSAAYWKLPTLCWLGHTDGWLHGLALGGVGAALLAVAGLAPLPALFAAWVLYLSLVIAGQTFLSFQWDTLLLETGFAALLVAPTSLWPYPPIGRAGPPRMGVWLLRLLLFKLMFLSGIVKLLSLDPTWWKLTALDYHYYTQPLPTWTAWYAHQLPAWVQRVSVALMFVIELGVPFLIFCGRAARRFAFAALVLLQLLIAGTGNYGFFNLLTIVLCLPLLDDAYLGRVLPRFLHDRPAGSLAPARRAPRWGSGPFGAGRALLAAFLVVASMLSFVREIERTASRARPAGSAASWLEASRRYLLSWGEPWVLDPIDPLHTVNGYGLFRSMTTARPEIEVEGSRDGRVWRPYVFRHKPGDPARRPGFVAPHQPRLDWQMWFAALDPRRAEPWLVGLARRLLEGSPSVLGLFESNPFPEAPPTQLRFIAYRYEFADRAEHEADGVWWKRQPTGVLYGPLSLDAVRTP